MITPSPTASSSAAGPSVIAGSAVTSLRPEGAGLDPATVEALVGDAVRAPSLHNSQPWRFRVSPDGVDVHADPSRMVGLLDPGGRALAVSVGAAVLNLRLSMLSRLGREPLTRLLPTPEDPTHLATVRPGRPREATLAERALVDAMPRRRTSREPFSEAPVPAAVMERLVTAARIEGGVLEVLGRERSEWVARLSSEAERQWAADRSYVEEVARWTTADPERRDGVPAHAFGPTDASGRRYGRDFGTGRHPGGRPSARFEAIPRLAVLMTRWDDPISWVRAGQALQRVLLTATDAGLATGILHQAVEDGELRRLLRDPQAGFGSAQVVLRLGWRAGEDPVPPPVPRRPVGDVLDYVG
jgi:nitroreductase